MLFSDFTSDFTKDETDEEPVLIYLTAHNQIRIKDGSNTIHNITTPIHMSSMAYDSKKAELYFTASQVWSEQIKPEENGAIYRPNLTTPGKNDSVNVFANPTAQGTHSITCFAKNIIDA